MDAELCGCALFRASEPAYHFNALVCRFVSGKRIFIFDPLTGDCSESSLGS